MILTERGRGASGESFLQQHGSEVQGRGDGTMQPRCAAGRSTRTPGVGLARRRCRCQVGATWRRLLESERAVGGAPRRGCPCGRIFLSPLLSTARNGPRGSCPHRTGFCFGAHDFISAQRLTAERTLTCSHPKTSGRL